MAWFFHAGFPHSDISGSKLDWQLPGTFGSLPPPSSSSDAKASTKYSFQLITYLIHWNCSFYIYKQLDLQKISKITRIFSFSYMRQYFIHFRFGGDERIRTAGLPRAKRTLYQLSYIPIPLYPNFSRPKIGGPKSTRTTDLSVISGVL